MKLIVGLGNPGKKYENTRHNVGFMAVQWLVDSFAFEPFKKSAKHKCEMTEGFIGSEKVILMKPQTFMNLSGQAVQSVAQFYKIPVEDAIIISDDVNIDTGTLRIRRSGSAGGHNGLKSIIQELGTDEFVRVRIGIKPLIEFKGDLEDYVLGKLTKDEQVKVMTEVMSDLPNIIEVLLNEGVEKAMHQFN
ncbi:aminoacyl-tRNA hydrolase [candidate division KSB1 bacterium]